MLKKFLPLTLLAVTTAAFAAGNQTTPTSSVANSASASTSATAASSTTSTTSTPASPVVVSSPSQAQAQHELTVQVDHLPQSLDPLKADVFGKDADTLYLVSAALVAPKPELTTLDHSTTSKDFRTWELTLKPRFWSDGKPVTAAEYVAAFHRLAQAPQGQDVLAVLKLQNFPEVASGALPVEKLGVSAKDEHTLVLTLSESKPNLTDYLTNPAFAPERADNDYGPDKFLSSGLYKVAQATDSSLTLVRNERNKGADTYAKLTLTTSASSNHLLPGLRRDYVGFNAKVYNREQRLVLTRALSRQVLNAGLLDTNSLHLASVQYYHPDQNLENGLLSRLGNNYNNKLAVNVLAWEGDKAQVEKVLTLYLEDNFDLGFSLDVHAEYVDYPTYLKRLQAKDFQAAYLSKAVVTNNDFYATLRCGSPSNFFNYCNSAFDQHLTQAQAGLPLTQAQAGLPLTQDSQYFDWQNPDDYVRYEYGKLQADFESYSKYVELYNFLRTDPVVVEVGRERYAGVLDFSKTVASQPTTTKNN